MTSACRAKRFGEFVFNSPVEVSGKSVLDAAIDGSGTESVYVGEMTIKGTTSFTFNGNRVGATINIEAEFRRERSAEK